MPIKCELHCCCSVFSGSEVNSSYTWFENAGTTFCTAVAWSFGFGTWRRNAFAQAGGVKLLLVLNKVSPWVVEPVSSLALVVCNDGRHILRQMKVNLVDLPTWTWYVHELYAGFSTACSVELTAWVLWKDECNILSSFLRRNVVKVNIFGCIPICCWGTLFT